MELFEAKRTELPAASDAVNRAFVRSAVGPALFAAAAIACRAAHGLPLGDGFRVLPASELA